jgi:hypothetical protein
MSHDFKIWVIQKVRNIAFAASEIIIDTQDTVATRYQSVTQM